MTTVLHRNGSDTYTRKSHLDSNYVDSNKMRLQIGVMNGYLYFPRPVPLGATVLSATLRVQSYAITGSGSRRVSVQRTGERVAYSRMTWRSMPERFGSSIGPTKTGPLPNGEVWEIDVTEHIQSVADGERWTGWRIIADDDVPTIIHSCDSSRPPELEVTYSDAPDAPDDLVPSGGLVAATPKPVLRFSYIDVGGDTTLANVHVQIDPSGNFDAPAWDSGPVPASLPELDLRDTTFPGVPTGETRYWRVRVQDGAGLWSEWSDDTTFTYQPRGTVTVTSPTAPEFSDADPTVAWTFEGATQQSYEIRVNRLVKSAWQRVGIIGPITSTATEHTLPTRFLKRDGEYQFIVKVWDTHERVATPAYGTFTSDTVVSAFAEDATIPRVSSITATGTAPYPFVDLEWTYPHTLPEGWAIMRGTETIARLDYDEVVNDNGVFRFRDRTAAPHQLQRYRIRAVVNNRMSQARWTESADITPRPFGVWLLDEDGTNDLVLMDVDEGTWGMGEETTPHAPLNGSKVVAITQSLRGYEGGVSGLLVSDIPGVNVTAQEFRDRAMALKENPRQALRLVIGDMNMPVTVSDIIPQPMPMEEIMFTLSFNFWQMDDFPFEAA